AANGMDAFTQLLESFVSTRSNPLTDPLARSGLQAAMDGLLAWHAGGEGAAAGREGMAYASLLSGICLAHTGLGSVHGLAQPLGSFFPIAHGVVCGTLLASATRVNVEALREREPDSPALAKYAEVGRMLAGDDRLDADAARAALLTTLEDWTRQLRLPSLTALGVLHADCERIGAHSRGSSMKTNPIVLTDEEIRQILLPRLDEAA
ncbi:MAG: iron-containing alcohol dehydrogenase, partial [Methylococcus sp.]